MPGITDEKLGAVVRATVREVIYEIRAATTAEPSEDESASSLPAALSPYDMVGVAKYALRDSGPLHVRELAKRMYALGFKHRRQPTNARQLESSLNSLASPSRQPSAFVRVKPRTLALR
jgi:hypothetical protein